MLNFVVTTYDAYNRLATETDARGNIKTHAYEHARGLHLGTTYTVVDGTAETAARSFTYNHLGQMTQVIDDAGTRTLGYNAYAERESDSLVIDGVTHLITELRDAFGRSTGYTYSKNGLIQQTVSTGYGTDGRIDSVGFMHGGEIKQFGYEYLQGSNLLHKLTKPNGMTLTQTYETTRDLLTDMAYHRDSTLVAQRTYTYDILGRPTARGTSRQGSVVNDTFAHNTRSELVEALVNTKEYEYDYDNIGNREFALEDGKASMYDTNALNQYTSISENGAAAFVPQFDADGNQTLIKTDTGIWSAVYNAENRPVTFTNSESNTVVECQYDSMGRRAYKKVSVNGSVTLHQRYIYLGYLQIACIDLTRSHHPALWYITWDITQPVATRPLALQISGTWYTYGWDLTKNICELYSTSGFISNSYTYTPFGSVTISGAVSQPIQWSSEVRDNELGMVYYNWRYYNAIAGRWTGRDLLIEGIEKHLYKYCNGNTANNTDILGLLCSITYSIKLHKLIVRKVDENGTINRITTDRLFSGNGRYTNDPNSTAEPNSGPIPPGKYYVIERQSGGRLGKIKELFYEWWTGNDRTKWLALIAIDDKIDNSITVNGVIRSNFRMHPGSTSLGCITFMDFSVFEMVRQFILDTESAKVQNAMGGEYIYYGILEVKAE